MAGRVAILLYEEQDAELIEFLRFFSGYAARRSALVWLMVEGYSSLCAGGNGVFKSTRDSRGTEHRIRIRLEAAPRRLLDLLRKAPLGQRGARLGLYLRVGFHRFMDKELDEDLLEGPHPLELGLYSQMGLDEAVAKYEGLEAEQPPPAVPVRREKPAASPQQVAAQAEEPGEAHGGGLFDID